MGNFDGKFAKIVKFNRFLNESNLDFLAGNLKNIKVENMNIFMELLKRKFKRQKSHHQLKLTNHILTLRHNPNL
jgi:hypothetical protein